MSKARVISFYLPQFHPVPENDLWWGKGFTEWTNVAKAKPLYRSHVQPKIPADLGFYDLRLPEVRKAQADMAREAGVEGFCYWHYWFGNGRQILEKPFESVVKSGEPDFPFCLAWANHSWTNKTWQKNKTFQKDTVFLEQTYGDDEDYIAHFNSLLPAFKDERYITVDGRLLFLIYMPFHFENLPHFIKLWQSLAEENGLPGFYFVGTVETLGRLDRGYSHDYTQDAGENIDKALALGLDAVNTFSMRRAEMLSSGKNKMFYRRILNHVIPSSTLQKYSYKTITDNWFCKEDSRENVFPTIMPRWDRTPRLGRGADIYDGSTPELFKKHVNDALRIIENKNSEHKIVFLRAWNEWGEGNFMEPDLEWGNKYCEALAEALFE
ncbi:MAG: glycoside hydrolase family 99-like domain-containing protein [Bifidobacteriaceae bacterium]|nr:glycoside hydrolase family 99-like domain-containing protein [Bifidobacteriaceae bacterium]